MPIPLCVPQVGFEPTLYRFLAYFLSRWDIEAFVTIVGLEPTRTLRLTES